MALNNPDNGCKSSDKTKKRVEKMFDYYSDEKKRAMSMFDYYTGNINKNKNMNLVIENGTYADEKEIEKRKKLAVKYLNNSNLWQGVISFNNDYLTQNIDIHKLEKELAINVLPKFFRKCGFKDIGKMFYQLALHTDTDNLHFHFSFMEKEPNYEYFNNKIGYRRNGQLSQNEINFLKSQVIHTIEKEKIYTPLLIETNKEITKLKKYFNPNEKNFLLKDKSDLLLEDKILQLGKILYNDRINKKSKIKYNSLKSKEAIALTKEIKKHIFNNSNSNLNNEYNKFKESLYKINNYFDEIYKKNNINNSVDYSVFDNKQKYIDSYINNSIINYADIYFKNKNKIDDNSIINNIVLNNYVKNGFHNRYKLLNNYFSNRNTKFKNRSEIELSIRNINKEMDEAKEEFSKLFINNNEKKG
jgi:hypothetical protein